MRPSVTSFLFPAPVLPAPPPRRRRSPARQIAVFCLTTLLGGTIWLTGPRARAQTSTPIYGDDSRAPYDQTPPLHFVGGPTYSYSLGTVRFGQTGQFVLTYGGAYDPDPVDVTQGFVARLDLRNNGSNGAALVIKNPTAPYYIETPQNPARGTVEGIGANGLASTLAVNFIAFDYSKANHNDRHYKGVRVVATNAASQPTILANIQGLDLDSSLDGNNILQVRYLPRFGTLDVYIGSRLITRVANVDLSQLGVAPQGAAEIGAVSGDPGIQNNNDSANYYDLIPADLYHFDIGNQLVFSGGFGPNYYEDRFPFLTTGQSVWGPGSDSVEYQKFLGATSNGQTKTSSTVGTDFSVAGQPIFSLATSGFASYDVGIGIDATATGGTADISYPLFLNMVFPKQYSVASGTAFTLPMAFYPDLAATIKTTSPSANVKADLKCITTFGVNLDTSVFGHSLASGQLFAAHVNVPDTTFFDAQQVIQSGLIPGINGGVNYAGYLQGNEGSKGTKNPTHTGTPGAGSTTGSKAGSLLSKFVSVGITIPDLSTSGTATGSGATGSHLTSTAASPFVSLSSDFTNAVLEEIPGLDILTALPFFNNDYTLGLGGHSVELGFHIADIYGGVNLGTAVSYDFTPQPQVYLILDPADPVHPNPWGPFSLDPATNRVLNPPALTMPPSGQPLTVTPRIVLNSAANPSMLQTKGSFTIGGSLSINPLSLSFGYDDNKFSTDPYFGFPLTVAGSIPVYTITKNFSVGTSSGGAARAVPFQSYLEGKSFTLFPTASPNPVIDSVTDAATAVKPATPNATLPISLATEQASFQGDVVWDYDGVPTNPQTTLPNRQWSSGSSVTAAIPYSLLTVQGTHTIVVLNHNTDAQLFPSNRVTFTVNAPVPALSVLNARTSSGTVVAGGTGFALDVSGSRFSPPVAASGNQSGYPGSVVLWNGQPLVTTYSSASSLSAAVPLGLIKTAGTAQISVMTAGPGGGKSGTLNLSIVNPAPTLASLSQTQIAPGLTTLDINLNGTGFLPGSTVLLTTGTQSVSRTAAYASPALLTLTLSAADLSSPGAHTLQVQNPAPGGGTTAPLSYTVGQAPATVGGVAFAPTVTRTAAGYVVSLAISNTSTAASADSIYLSSATVGGDSTGKNAIYPTLPSPLQPILISSIPAQGKVTPTQTYTFPASIGTSGQAVLLTIQGSIGDKIVTSRLRVVLP